jgi:4-amino-4-deoxy-L-arabinose transferase-like glycosyltransferase
VRHLNRAAIYGFLAAAGALLVVCMAVSSAIPPLKTADETAHMDYAVQVWHGHLPVFEKGLTFRPPAPASVPPVQWESQHPPLFYALVAPLAGPLADAGHWVLATMAVRMANSVLTALCALAIGWAAWLLGGTRRLGRALTAAAVTGTIGSIMYVGGTAYSDNINTLMSTLALGIGLLAVASGPTWRIIIAACVVAALGTLSRSEFAIALAVMLLGLVLAALIHGNGSVLQRLFRGAWTAALPIVSAAVFGGWFFLRNKRLTGNFGGGQPEWAAVHLHRRHRSIAEVLANRDVRNTQYSLLRHPIDGRGDQLSLQHRIDTKVMVTLFVVCVLVGVLAILWRLARSASRREFIPIVQAALLALTLLFTVAFEIEFTAGGGGSVSRYLLPAALPICLLIVASLRAVGPRFQPILLGIYLLICDCMFSYWLLTQPHDGGKLPTGVPWPLVYLVPVLLLVAIVVQVRALVVIQRPPADRENPAREPVAVPG